MWKWHIFKNSNKVFVKLCESVFDSSTFKTLILIYVNGIEIQFDQN